MTADEARDAFRDARVARLATADADGRPHLVPMTFALLDDDMIVSAVDHKPKRTTALKRLANIEVNPRVAVLVDRYSDDWSQLWWARADGTARVADEPIPAALVERYAPYREHPPDGPLVVIAVERWSGWSAA